MSIKAVTVPSSDLNGFTETTRFQILHCGNVDGNNNKFFSIELQKNPTTNQYRIYTENGRVNTSIQRRVRGPSDLNSLEREFDSIVKKKLRPKTRKNTNGEKYTEKYEAVEVVAPTVGSPNIRQSGPIKSGNVGTSFVDTFTNSSYEPQVKSLLSKLLAENVHNITSLSSVSVTSNGLETPLGPVTSDHIAKARNVLDQLRDITDRRFDDRQVRDLNTHYLSLIPHDIGRKITESDCILDDGKLLEEYDLLKQMDSALQVADQNNDSDVDIGLDMTLVTDQDTINDISDGIMSTRHDRHRHLWDYRVKNVYDVCNRKERDRFNAAESKYDGPQYNLYHGSRNANLLSILMNGFYVPPVSAPHVTGRMFGNGVYGASASTKALNYSTGYWSGTRSQSNSVFMFITRFSMGRVYEADSAVYGGAPHGYDSIHAKAGRALLNDEYIVYNLDQTTITHLIELEK